MSTYLRFAKKLSVEVIPTQNIIKIKCHNKLCESFVCFERNEFLNSFQHQNGDLCRSCYIYELSLNKENSIFCRPSRKIQKYICNCNSKRVLDRQIGDFPHYQKYVGLTKIEIYNLEKIKITDVCETCIEVFNPIYGQSPLKLTDHNILLDEDHERILRFCNLTQPEFEKEKERKKIDPKILEKIQLAINELTINESSVLVS